MQEAGVTKNRRGLKLRTVLRPKYLKFLVPVLLIIVIGVTLILTHTSRPASSDSLQAVENKVSKHMLLPTNEQPALLKVVDKNELESPFLKDKAQNGDEILVYKNNRIAIIYRPSIDRIVGVGTVSIDTPPTSNSSN